MLSINVDRTVMMETRDGTRLAAEVYRPEGAGPCPSGACRSFSSPASASSGTSVSAWALPENRNPAASRTRLTG